MKNLIQRSIWGTVYVMVLIAGMFVNEWAFFTVFLFASVATLIEYVRLFNKGNQFGFGEFGVVLGGGLIFALSFLVNKKGWDIHLWYSMLLPLSLILFKLLGHDKIDRVMDIKKAAGLFYIVLPFVLMQLIVFANGSFNGLVLFYIFLFIWVYDSFAYVFGVQFGKNRIWPSVSPKKSWEGSFGGLFSVGVACTILWKTTASDFNLMHWLGFGLVVVVSATLGDFFESYLKRRAGVKDSGNMIPGHGGFFDRFDSTLFAVPASVVYLHLFQLV